MGALRVLASVLGIFVVASASASEYIWPLQQYNGISATFGESRENHFHAGIDLSTNGKTGLPVLAVADGVVYRMKIQKRAYGKALYIRHPNGMHSVYAHLQSYSEDLGLERIYQDQVAQKQTPYVGDVFVDPGIPVKQGQVVAYSGESGAGLPHLHFELRKNEDVALNPLLNGFQDTLDPVPPTFQACYLYPMDSNSAIDGNLETKQIRFTKSSTGYAAKSVPVVRGDFLMSVSVYDSALRPYHRAPRKIWYSIDGSEIYAVDFDHFSYIQPSGFGLFYDLGKPGPYYYEYPVRMSKLIDASFPFVKKAVPFSTASLAPGRHDLQIQASDTNGNVSMADLPFIVNQPPSFVLNSVQMANGELIVDATLTDGNQRGAGAVSGRVEYSLDGGKKFVPFVSTSLSLGGLSVQGHYEYRTSSPYFAKARSILIRGRAFDGVEYSAYELAKFQPERMATSETVSVLPPGKLQVEPYRQTIQVTYETRTPVVGRLQVTTAEPTASFPLLARDPAYRVASIPAPHQNADLKITLPGGHSLLVPVHFFKAGTPAEITEKNFHLSLSAKSLYADTFVWTKLVPQKPSRILPVIGSVLQITPRGLPMNEDAALQLPYSSRIPHPEKLNIYRWDRSSEKWKPLPSSVEPTTKTVEAKISYFDRYALIYDNAAPVITPIFPRRRASVSDATPVLRASIRDAGTDVDDERVTFFVDGVPFVADYDPDRNTAVVEIREPLRKGYHKFSVRAYDFAGNESRSSTITFRVK